jgi:hypothetical protein
MTIAELTDKILNEVRLYLADPYFTADCVEDETWPCRLPLKLPDSERYAVAVRHECRLNPPGFSMAAHVPPQLKLPADVMHFFTHIPEASLHWIFDNFRVFLPGLLDCDGSPDEWRLMKPPFRLLRFCEMSYREMYYALRSKDDGKSWDVIYTCVGEADQDAAESFPTLHSSFTDWLQYLMENDGWPPLKSHPEAPGLYRHFDRRIPDNEAAALFGSLSALLPAPECVPMEFEPGQFELLQERWRLNARSE